MKTRRLITIIFQTMQKEYERLQTRIVEVKAELKKMPEGKLICAKGGNSYKWYISDGHKKSYLPKKERNLAEKLAYKKYLTLLLEDLEQERIAISFYLRHCSPNYGKATHLLTSPSGHQELLSPHFKPISKELSDWMNSPYEQNTNYPEYLIHATADGKLVRSKSEVMIYQALYMRRIPFRYECALDLGGAVFYPDFTIRHPITGKYYYWEHCGRMDDEMYSKKVFDKQQFMNAHGIKPSDQLIITYEDKENPLQQSEIETIIEKYFL